MDPLRDAPPEPLPLLGAGTHDVTIVSAMPSRHRASDGEWTTTIDRHGRPLFAVHFSSATGRARAFFALTSAWRPRDDNGKGWLRSKLGLLYDAALGPNTEPADGLRSIVGHRVRIVVELKSNGKPEVQEVLAP